MGAVAIVADRRLSVAALTALLLRDPNYRLVREARGISDVREALSTYRPETVVLDCTTPESSASVSPSDWNGRTLLLLDPEDDPAVFLNVVHADGYLSRGAARETFGQALKSLAQTGGYMDPVLVGPILSVMSRIRTTPIASRHQLSQRQRDIVVRIASGRSTKEVAKEYAITAKTVGNHINNICRKLNLSHRGELVLYAVQQGLTRL